MTKVTNLLKVKMFELRDEEMTILLHVSNGTSEVYKEVDLSDFENWMVEQGHFDETNSYEVSSKYWYVARQINNEQACIDLTGYVQSYKALSAELEAELAQEDLTRIAEAQIEMAYHRMPIEQCKRIMGSAIKKYALAMKQLAIAKENQAA
jgi:hypothetical protein